MSSPLMQMVENHWLLLSVVPGLLILFLIISIVSVIKEKKREKKESPQKSD
jgi:hypothetical protein